MSKKVTCNEKHHYLVFCSNVDKTFFEKEPLLVNGIPLDIKFVDCYDKFVLMGEASEIIAIGICGVDALQLNHTRCRFADSNFFGSLKMVIVVKDRIIASHYIMRAYGAEHVIEEKYPEVFCKKEN